MPVPARYDINNPALVSAIDDVPVWSAPFGLALLEEVDLRPNLVALDVGSGLGFPSIELAQRLGSTGRVFGIDPWTAANERARRKIDAWGLDNITILEGKAEKLPFADETLDLVISNNGTNNVEDEAQTYREIARTAKDNAQILLTVNLPETMLEFYSVYEDVLKRRGMKDCLDKLTEHINHKRKPADHVCNGLAAAGIKVEDVRHDSFTIRYVNGTAMLENPLIRLAFRPSWEEVIEPNEVEGVFAEIAEVLDKQAATKGELGLSVPWVLIKARRSKRIG